MLSGAEVRQGMRELSVSELQRLPDGSFLLIDTRSADTVQFGMIPGAIHIPEAELMENAAGMAEELSPNSTLIVYCQRGLRSVAVAEAFDDCGRECFSLAGGYLAWLRANTNKDEDRVERQKKAEESIRRKFHKQLFSPFAKACKDYQLIQDGDRIAVCISGGKDSMLMAKLFQELQRHRKVSFELLFLVMDPGYNHDNRRLLEQFSQGKKVLNMFCYTGGFSVYAMRGGATLVHSVDSSSRAIEITDANIALNFKDTSAHQSFSCDAFRFMADMTEDYDIIVLDPPAFAKHRDALHNALKGYARLNAAAISKIKKGGIIFTFSCSQAVSPEQFRTAVFTAAARANRFVRILCQLHQPADHPVNIYHPEGEYLKGLVLYVE